MGPTSRKGLTRDATSYEAYQELLLQLDIFKARRRRGSGGAAARRAARQPRPLRAAEGTREASSTSSICCTAHATWCATTTPCARSFQVRFARLFVDEFQDTDPLQAELLLLLRPTTRTSATGQLARPVPGKLFIVGDPKQSIYRFRRADVQVYHEVCRQLLDHGARHLDAHHQLPRARRTCSVPSTPAFGAEMIEDAETLQAGYIPLSPSRATTSPASRRVVALPVPRPYGRRNISGMAIEQSLPDAVGAFVDWLVQRERMEGHDPAGPGDARAGPAGPRLHPVPAVRQLRDRRHARLRGRARGPRRAATCSSAAARSTTARRSRRCAPRWPRSNGPTTSCRCSRRCAARCSRSATKSCSSTGIAYPRALASVQGARGCCPRTCSRSATR